MKTIKVVKNKVENLEDYVRRPAKREDFKELITEDCILEDENGRMVLLYFKFKNDTSKLLNAVQTIPYETSTRSGGLKTTSRIFGYDPATGIRKPYCSATRLAFDNPKEHEIITRFGEEIAEVYKKYLPNVYTSHEQLALSKIKDEWRIPTTPFTSGIINKNNQLNYHFDSGNFKDVYSNMIVMKNNVAGGYLALPEYGVGLECANETLVMFDGQSILHGVTPIKFFGQNAYRYSLVYYTLENFWKCDELTAEVVKIRNRRSQIEKFNADGKVVDKNTEGMLKRRTEKGERFKRIIDSGVKLKDRKDLKNY